MKYSYDDILNNDVLIKSLKSAVTHGRVGHAYIFDGEKGIGKKSIAQAFAKTLNCEKGGDSPCGECSACRTFDDGNNPDVIYVSEKGIKVDTVREKINKEIMTRPYSYKYKVFIIEDAHDMNPAAQNAFLKTLEEPPDYVVFLLLSRNFNRFLPTILSRCILFRLNKVPQPALKAYLLQNGLSQNDAETMSHYAQGIVGRALELKNDDNFRELSAFAMQLCLKIDKLDIIQMYRETDALKEKKDDIKTLLQLMRCIFRDALVYKVTNSANGLINGASLPQIKEICGMFTTRRLIKACDAVFAAEMRADAKADFQFNIEELFYKIKEKRT